MENRDVHFDIAKGIAIYFVVLGHYLSQVAEIEINFITFWHMPLFFYISGYFLFNSLGHKPPKTIINQKIRSLFIPFIVWSGISLIVNIVLIVWSGKFTVLTLRTQFVNIFLMARSVWFLLSLFITVSLFIIGYCIAERYKVRILIVEIVLWILGVIVLPSDYFSLYKWKWLFPFFIVGYWIAKYSNKGNRANRRALIFSLSICILFVGKFFYSEEMFEKYITCNYGELVTIGYGILYYLTSFVLVCGFLRLSKELANCKKFFVLQEIGKNSMDIYVLHMFFIKIFVWRSDWLISHHLFYTYIYIPCYIMCICIVIWLLNKYILQKSKCYKRMMGKR